MSEEHSPSFRLQRRVNILLALFLFPLVMILLPMFMTLGYVWHRNPQPGMAPWLVYGACLVVASLVALAWSLRNLHFIFAYGKWPKHAGPALADGRIWPAAKEAFFEGDYTRCLALLERYEAGQRDPLTRLALGRALVWMGRLEEGSLEIEASELDASGLKWLRTRTVLGWEQKPYFSAEDPRRTAQWGGLLALTVGIVLALGLGLGLAFEKKADFAQIMNRPYFDQKDFQVETRGTFILHYHDRAFKEQVAAIVEGALQHDLEVLGLPGDSFGAGTIQLYLCDSREEYRSRAPQAPEWESGSADAMAQSVYIYKRPAAGAINLEILLAHELGHLCLAKLIPAPGDHWLNEGLAEYLGHKYALDRAGFARRAWLKEHIFKSLGDDHIPFQEFFALNPRLISDAKKVDLFYLQGFSIVTMLAENYGQAPLNRFLSLYGRGAEFDRALAGAFPSLPNVEALSAVWGLFYRAQNENIAPK